MEGLTECLCRENNSRKFEGHEPSLLELKLLFLHAWMDSSCCLPSLLRYIFWIFWILEVGFNLFFLSFFWGVISCILLAVLGLSASFAQILFKVYLLIKKKEFKNKIRKIINHRNATREMERTYE